ncbi:hypothetical protein Rsub_08276 [Raphidocelis subcapitata]|uniref:Uncharacterized protein n=1 Tax=Raphidocelis subcapitata TaxID=307507 RepID=A0A2V0PDT1_9CHLO|nr:hypothetical protein Rsub_08276 [Raphidocelis subcapitata]|eukprot:GBF95245.1 hypothetical protein Rsub_08276 [Raphidocelis subcapitata]
MRPVPQYEDEDRGTSPSGRRSPAAADDDAAPADDGAGAAPLLPDLDGGALLGFLTAALQDLEEAQGGGPDDEARGLLAQLEAQLGAGAGGPGAAVAREPLRARMPGGGALPPDLMIASHIDSLTEQLAAVELQFASLEEGAKQLVCAGASVWMGGAAAGGGGGPGGEAGGGTAEAGEAGAAAAAEDGGAHGQGDAADGGAAAGGSNGAGRGGRSRPAAAASHPEE